jgi:hypothetical protein
MDQSTKAHMHRSQVGNDIKWIDYQSVDRLPKRLFRLALGSPPRCSVFPPTSFPSLKIQSSSFCLYIYEEWWSYRVRVARAT